MLVGAMKKLAPLLALLVAGCSGADTVDNAASFTTNNAVGAVDEQAPNAETSGDTTFSKIFGEQAEAAGVRDYLENHGKFDTALMKDSLNAAGLQLSMLRLPSTGSGDASGGPGNSLHGGYGRKQRLTAGRSAWDA